MSFLTLKDHCFFKNSINEEEVKAISQAHSKKNIITLWDRICDWFCDTHRVEAKTNLFVLMNEAHSSEERLNAFFKLRDLCAETYKNNFDLYTQKYLNMESFDDISDQEKNSDLVLCIKGSNLEVNIKLSNEEIKNNNTSKTKLLDYIENKYTTEGQLQTENQLLKDINRFDYDIIEKDNVHCFRIDDSNLNKTEIAEKLLSNLNLYQRDWCNILCSQTLINGAFDYIQKRHSEGEFISVGSDFEYHCDMEFINKEAILVKVNFYNENDKEKIRVIHPDSTKAYKEVCFKASFLIKEEDLVVLNVQYFGNNQELVLND